LTRPTIHIRVIVQRLLQEFFKDGLSQDKKWLCSLVKDRSVLKGTKWLCNRCKSRSSFCCHLQDQMWLCIFQKRFGQNLIGIKTFSNLQNEHPTQWSK
jgi:hypothetical protein